MSNPDELLKELEQLRGKKDVIALTSDEALAVLMEADLSKFQYLLIRFVLKSKNADVFPAYERILEAKERCYPPKESIIVTESKAEVSHHYVVLISFSTYIFEVPLSAPRKIIISSFNFLLISYVFSPLKVFGFPFQVRVGALFDLTARRLIESLKPKIDTSVPRQLVLKYKGGCDGSSGYSEYKQGYENENHCDSNLFTVTVSPLLLSDTSEDSKSAVLYKNPHPSSTRSCRPVQLIWAKETPELIKSVVEDVKGQVSECQTTVIGNVQVKHEVHFTMIDGKVCNTLTDTKCSKVCYICKVPPSLINDLQHVKSRPIDKSALEFGIAPLHAHIRCFEYFLHIGYKVSGLPLLRFE